MLNRLKIVFKIVKNQFKNSVLFGKGNPQLTLRLNQIFFVHNLSSLRNRVAIMWVWTIYYLDQGKVKTLPKNHWCNCGVKCYYIMYCKCSNRNATDCLLLKTSGSDFVAVNGIDLKLNTKSPFEILNWLHILKWWKCYQRTIIIA